MAREPRPVVQLQDQPATPFRRRRKAPPHWLSDDWAQLVNPDRRKPGMTNLAGVPYPGSEE